MAKARPRRGGGRERALAALSDGAAHGIRGWVERVILWLQPAQDILTCALHGAPRLPAQEGPVDHLFGDLVNKPARRRLVLDPSAAVLPHVLQLVMLRLVPPWGGVDVPEPRVVAGPESGCRPAAPDPRDCGGGGEGRCSHCPQRDVRAQELHASLRPSSDGWCSSRFNDDALPPAHPLAAQGLHSRASATCKVSLTG